MKVLLFTASFGDGHNQAARAVQEGLEQEGIAVHWVDYVDWLHPAVRSFAKFSLVQSVQKMPSLYGLFYHSMSRIPPSSTFQRRLHHLGIRKMRQCLRHVKPDVVVSTFPTPMGVLSELKAARVAQVPSVGILTDYTAHGQWVQEYTDVYFVPTEEVANELEQLGVDRDKIKVSGIPLRRRFSSANVQNLLKRRMELREKFGFSPNLPLILLSGGGEGLLGDSAEWEEAIRQSGLQFAILCAHNERLLRRYGGWQDQRVQALEFRSDIEDWMAASDLLITKAGGLTISEALAMELPMLIVKPIPGQEIKNTAYAEQIGAAVRVDSVAEAVRFIQHVELHPEKLSNMRLAARLRPQYGGVEQIVSVIRDLGESQGKWDKQAYPGIS